MIVLAIIGVVAALTVPSLMNNIQDAQFKTAAKKAYSVSSAAVTHIKQDEGGSLSSYIGNAYSFKPIFIKYFNIIKDCGNELCVPQLAASDLYTSLSGDKATTDVGGEGQFVTFDGMFFNIQNSTDTNLKIIIIVDVNGYKKQPNIYGKDTFAFQVINDNLLPMGVVGSSYVSTTCCKKSTSASYQGFGCMSNVMQGIDY